MNKFRPKLLLLGSILVAAVASAWFYTREPTVEGRTLSEWLVDIDRVSDIDKMKATNAIRKIGPATIPILLKKLNTQDPRWKIALSDSKYRDWFPYRWRRLGWQHEQALNGFAVLGSNAAPALPELTRMLNDSNVAWRACTAMAHIGVASWPQLKASLDSPMPYLREAASSGLYHVGDINDFWPQLERAIRDKDDHVAFTAVGHIARNLDHTGAVELIREALARTNQPAVPYSALFHLSMLGTNQARFVPDVIPLLSGPTSSIPIRQLATWFVLKFDPVTAAANGIDTNASN